MRPIDADYLESKVHRVGNESGRVYWYDVEDAPTLDMQPIVHAHWYFDPDKSIGCGITVSGMFCSNCGSDCPTGSHPYRVFKYCPYCGAKMDEVGESKKEKWE